MSKQFISKKRITDSLISAGYTDKESETIWKLVQDAIKESILNRDNIVIRGVGTLEVEVRSAGSTQLFGHDITTKDRIKVKFRQSNYLSGVYRSAYSDKAKNRAKLLAAFKK